MIEIDPDSARGERRRAILLTLAMLLPLALVVFFVYVAGLGSNEDAKTPSSEVRTNSNNGDSSIDGRLIVIIVDTLRRQAVDEVMPNLKALAQQRNAVYLDVHTAGGNMTLPCIQTLLEGRESPYVSGIHNITGARSLNSSLPAAAERAGLRPSLVSDYIIKEFYGRYATVSIDLNAVDPSTSILDRDLGAISQTINLLADEKIRVIILHVPGTDFAAHKWLPGHPEYENHFRKVDAKLSELFAHLDLKKDQLIVTGDHGHNDRGNHVPISVAIFAGGIYPQLFAALGPLGELQQIDMLFFMSFPQNLPLPVRYEGRYFGLENPLDPAALTPELKSRFETFAALQKETLSTAGFDAPRLEDAIAAKRAQAGLTDAATLRRALPLLVLYIAWIAFGFYLNDAPSARIWPLFAMAIPALGLWLFTSPATGIGLAAAIVIILFGCAAKAGELRRVCFLFLLAVAAAFTAYEAESWHRFLAHGIVRTFLGLGGLVAAGAVLLAIRGGGVYGWPAALCAICLFALPSGVYETQFGFNILRGFFMGCALFLIGLIAQRRFLQIRFRGREWIVLGFLGLAIALLLWQRAHGLVWHHDLLDWLSVPATRLTMSALFYLGCAGYLVWIVEEARVRLVIAAFLVVLPLYCSWFAQLSFPALAVALIVPVFLASWLVVTNAPGPLRDSHSAACERAGLLLTAALLMAFWILFEGFFVHRVDFTFGLKVVNETAPEGRLVAFLYPLTLLKYGLPLAFIVFVYLALAEPANSRRTMIAALLFCNFKLATLLVQILVGPIHSHRKLYELAMSDFVFVSHLELIVALTYLALLLGRPVFNRLAFARTEIGLIPVH